MRVVTSSAKKAHRVQEIVDTSLQVHYIRHINTADVANPPSLKGTNNMQGTQLTLNFDAIAETASQTFDAPKKPHSIAQYANHAAVDGLGFIDDGNYFAVLKSGETVHFKSVFIGGRLYGRVLVKDGSSTVCRHEIHVNQDADYLSKLDAFDYACAKILETVLQ